MPTGAPTGQDVVNGALLALGLIEGDGNPSVSDSNVVLRKLNEMWDAWGIDEGLIYAILVQQFPLTAGIGGYTIGDGAQFNVDKRPGRIYRGSVMQASGGAISASAVATSGQNYQAADIVYVVGGNGSSATLEVDTVDGGGGVLTFHATAAGTGYIPQYGAPTTGGSGTGFTINITAVTAGGQNRNELKIVNAETYYAHNDLNAASAIPDEMYPDYAPDFNGYSRLWFYPCPKVLQATQVELEFGAPFLDWTLSGTYNIPQGFQDDLVMALAYRVLPLFGVAVAQEVAQLVMQQGEKAEARIRAMNALNRGLPPNAEAPPGTQIQPNQAVAR